MVGVSKFKPIRAGATGHPFNIGYNVLKSMMDEHSMHRLTPARIYEDLSPPLEPKLLERWSLSVSTTLKLETLETFHVICLRHKKIHGHISKFKGFTICVALKVLAGSACSMSLAMWASLNLMDFKTPVTALAFFVHTRVQVCLCIYYHLFQRICLTGHAFACISRPSFGP